MDLEKKINILLAANERLEKENKMLREQLQKLPNVKALIDDLTVAKQTYEELHDELQHEIKEYKALHYELYKLKQDILKR